MGDAPESDPSSNWLDLETLRSRVNELTDIHRSCKDDVNESNPFDSEMKDWALHFQSRVNQLLSNYPDLDLLGIGELDAYYEHVKGELKLVEAENSKIHNEIEVLRGTYMKDLNRLEGDLEGLRRSLDFVASQPCGFWVCGCRSYWPNSDLGNARESVSVDCSIYTRDHLHKLQILQLNDQIEKDNIILKSLQGLDHIYKRFEDIEKVEDAMTGLKVIDFDKNCIRLSLRTHIPNLERIYCQQKIEDIKEPSELNHELLIEVMAGTMEIKNVEILPNDVYINEIIDAAKTFREPLLYSVLQTRSSLEWFVRKVQDRIILCTIRKYVIKGVNKSRHTLEYLDRDEMIVAHMVGGVSAFVRVSQGWPTLNSAMKLISLKSSDQHTKGISLSFLCKVEEVANSLDICIRQNISSFVDAIEETLMQQMSLELNSDVNPRK